MDLHHFAAVQKGMHVPQMVLVLARYTMASMRTMALATTSRPFNNRWAP
jgi:hypothetical protein